MTIPAGAPSNSGWLYDSLTNGNITGCMLGFDGGTLSSAETFAGRAYYWQAALGTSLRPAWFSPDGKNAAGSVVETPAVDQTLWDAEINDPLNGTGVPRPLVTVPNVIGQRSADATWPGHTAINHWASTYNAAMTSHSAFNSTDTFIESAIQQWSDLFSSTPRLTIVRLWHEQGNGIYGSTGGMGYTDALFKSNWAAIVKRLRVLGGLGTDPQTAHCMVAWCPASHPASPGDDLATFPGTDYVDVIGRDIYPKEEATPGNTWEEAAQDWYERYEPFVGSANLAGKPLMVFESGLQTDDSGRIAKVQELSDRLQGNHAQPWDKISAWLWWGGAGNDLSNTPAGFQAAYQAEFQDDYFLPDGILMTDTVITTDQNLDSLMIMGSDRYILDPAHDITITIAVNYANTAAGDNSIVIMDNGELNSHPDDDHDHTIVFTGIDETKYVGAPDGKGNGSNTGPPSTDPGIWVMDSGKLNCVGKTKVGWNRTGTDATWESTDECYAVPWDNNPQSPSKVDYGTFGVSPAVNPSYTLVTPNAYTPKTYVTVDGDTQYQEVFNITRNMHIMGTSTGKAHIMNMSDAVSTFHYVELRYMGPAGKLGRYSYHNHLRREGSRDTHFIGLIARDNGANVFVTHGSNGVTWTDCVAWGDFGTAYWYDPNNAPNQTTVDNYNGPIDVLYDSCASFGFGGFGSSGHSKGFIHDAIGFPDPLDASITSTNNRNECKNCVIVGSYLDGETGAYDWSAKLNGVSHVNWNWHDNVGHNFRGKMIFSWANQPDQHTVYRGKFWRTWLGNQPLDGTNGGDVDSGAYHNSYDFFDCVFDTVVADEVTSHGGGGGAPAGGDILYFNGIKALPGKNWARCYFRLFYRNASPLYEDSPTRLSDCVFTVSPLFDQDGVTKGDDANDGRRLIDLIRPNFTCDGVSDPVPEFRWNEDFFDTGMVNLGGSVHPTTAVRIQNIDGSSWQMDTPPGFCYHATTGSKEAHDDAGMTGGLPANTYNNGAAGVGATITATANGAMPQGVLPNKQGQGGTPGFWNDSLPTNVNDNAVITQQANPAQNGLYTVTQLGSATTPWKLTRHTIWDTTADMAQDIFVACGGGVHGATSKQSWKLFAASQPVTVGTTAITGVDPPRIARTWKSIPSFALYISTSSLSTAFTGAVYSQTLQCMFGTGQFGTALQTLNDPWSIVSGTLPTGMTFNGANGQLSGTPTQTGTFPLRFRVEDNKNFEADRDLTLTVNVGAPTLQVTTSSLPNGSLNVAYSPQTLTSTGGTGSVTWSLASGTLPTGLSLSSGGVISGTPTALGTSSFTVRVTDSVSATATRALSITVAGGAPTITTTSIPGGTVSTLYPSFQFLASGGTPPYAWNLGAVSDTVPGMAFSSGGVWSGTPTTLGSYHLRVKVTDALPATDTEDYSFTVSPQLAIDVPAILPHGTVGRDYAFDFTPYVSGGAPPYSFIVNQVLFLPEGLLITEGGSLEGSPTLAGTYDFQVIVQDSVGTSKVDSTQTIIDRRRLPIGRGVMTRGSTQNVSR